MLSKEHEQQIKETNEYKNSKNSLELKIKNLEKKNEELEKNNDSLNGLSDKNNILERHFQEKSKECLQLTQNLQAARDEVQKMFVFFLNFFFITKLIIKSCTRLIKLKDRNDVQKRCSQSQITGLEKEIVQLRAGLNIAHKDRDEVRERLQNDVARLERKLCESQIENRNLKTNSIAKVLYEDVSDTDSEHTIDTMMKNLNKRRSHT